MTRVSRTMGWQGRWRASLFAVAVMAAVSLERATLAQRVRVDEGMTAYLAHSAGTGSGMHGAQGYFGVDVRDVSDGPTANARGSRGAEILHVDHDAPAGKAGIREHDIVLSMNGQLIESGDALRRMLHETAPGRPVMLTILRGGQHQTVSAQMSTREDVERDAWAEPEPIVAASAGDTPGVRRGSGFFSAPGRAGRSLLGSIGSSAYTGVMLETMAPQLAEFFGAQGKSGMLVRSVDANSPASVAGLHAGDVVVRVNTVGIASNGDWTRVMRDNKGRAISVVVLRERHEQTLMMIPNAKHHSSLLPDMWPHFGSSVRSSSAAEHASVTPASFFR